MSIYCYEDKLVQEDLKEILEAEFFYEHLKNRMKHFGLNLEEEKSRLIQETGLSTAQNA